MIVMAKENPEVSARYARDMVIWFYDVKNRFDTQKAVFEENKADFKKAMDKYFNLIANEDGKVVIDSKDTLSGGKKITVTRVTPSKVLFDIDGIKSLLSKSNRKLVIKKNYSITNWLGLFELLKSHGVDFKEFMKYAKCEETIDSEQLDRLVELGEIDEASIRKFITVKPSNSYYKVMDK